MERWELDFGIVEEEIGKSIVDLQESGGDDVGRDIEGLIPKGLEDLIGGIHGHYLLDLLHDFREEKSNFSLLSQNNPIVEGSQFLAELEVVFEKALEQNALPPDLDSTLRAVLEEDSELLPIALEKLLFEAFVDLVFFDLVFFPEFLEENAQKKHDVLFLSLFQSHLAQQLQLIVELAQVG